MRKILFGILFSINAAIAFGQNNKISSLTKRINNQQLHGECQYFWSLEMESKAGQQLLSIGKSATEHLFHLLKDSTKGIIAHYLLSYIWLKTVCSQSAFEKDNSITYIVNGFRFSECDEIMYANKKELEANKEKWKDFLKNKDRKIFSACE